MSYTLGSSGVPNIAAAGLDGDDLVPVVVDGAMAETAIEELQERLAGAFVLGRWFEAGPITVAGIGTRFVDVPEDCEIVAVCVRLTAGSVTVDVNIDGTTIFTTQSNRPVVTSPAVVAWATTIQAGFADALSVIRVDVDAFSGSPANVSVSVWARSRRG